MRIVTLSAALGLMLCIGAGPTDGPVKQGTHTVTMESMRFHPDELTVAVGETIVWLNEDLVPHTATSRAGRFDSKEIEAGNSWRHTFSRKGDFPYVCTLHRNMKGILHVR